MIIVEGPDGAGKTTLVESLVERYGLPVEPKLVASDMSFTMSKKVWCEQDVAKGFRQRLFDRHCLISEPIYNSTVREKTEPGFDDVRWYTAMMTMFYRTCHPLIIYCLPPYGVVRENVMATGQPDRVSKNIRRIYALYTARAAADVASVGAMVYDYQETPIVHLYNNIDKAIERMGHEFTARPLW